MKYEILPSLLGADIGNLREGVLKARDSGADALHLDIMDPNFVPNISFGPDVVKLARTVAPELPRCVHLMMRRPDLYLEKFAAAGADAIQVHLESDCDLHTCLARIRALGIKNALVINPETPAEKTLPYLKEVDGILVMTVHPGYGGQSFISECLPKISFIRAAAPELDIMFDGGGNEQTIPLSAKAGANQFVAGSFLYRAPDMKAAVEDLRERLK